MGTNTTEMAEIKEWLKGSFLAYEKKQNDLFEPLNLGGRMALEQEENVSLGCVPIEEVEELLKKCAYELGMTYE